MSQTGSKLTRMRVYYCRNYWPSNQKTAQILIHQKKRKKDAFVLKSAKRRLTFNSVYWTVLRTTAAPTENGTLILSRQNCSRSEDISPETEQGRSYAEEDDFPAEDAVVIRMQRPAGVTLWTGAA